MIDIDKNLTSYHDGGNDYRYAFSKEEVAEIKQALEFYESALKNEDGYLSAMCERKECNNGWIPCRERLPDIEANVLLTLRSLDIYTGFRANTDGYFYVEGTDDGYIPFDNVIAWQPLPQPYKERGVLV